MLWWNDARAIAALNAEAIDKAATEAASTAAASGSYDLVLAADCIYENGAPEVAIGMAQALARTAGALLRSETAESLPLRGQSSPEEWHTWSDTAPACEASDEFVWPPRKHRVQGASAGEGGEAEAVYGGRPMCVVGFGRRNVPLEVLLDAFEAEGFEHHVPSAGQQ